MQWYTVQAIGSGQPAQRIQATSPRTAARAIVAPRGTVLSVSTAAETVRYRVSRAGRLVQQSHYCSSSASRRSVGRISSNCPTSACRERWSYSGSTSFVSFSPIATSSGQIANSMKLALPAWLFASVAFTLSVESKPGANAA